MREIATLLTYAEGLWFALALYITIAAAQSAEGKAGDHKPQL